MLNWLWWCGSVTVQACAFCWADLGALRKHWEISVFRWKASDKGDLLRENARDGCLFSTVLGLGAFLMQEGVWGFLPVWCLNIWCILFYRKYLLRLGARFMQAYTLHPKNQAEFYSRCLLHSHFPVRPSSLFPPLNFIPILSLYSPKDTSPLPPPVPCLYPVVSP